MDQNYRKSRIDKMLDQLNSDLTESEKQYKAHKSKGAALDKTQYGLTGATMFMGVGVLGAIASPPVGIAMGVMIGACGIAEIIIKTVYKKNLIKIEKWHNLCDLINDTHSKISLLVSDALDDRLITDTELRYITGIFDTYRTKLTILRNKYSTLEKNIKLEKNK